MRAQYDDIVSPRYHEAMPTPKPPPSPAAVRLKNARSAYARLTRAARDPNVDWFRKSLSHMLDNLPNQTCALHNWHEQIAGYVLWQTHANPAEKIGLILQMGPPMERAQHLMERCLRTGLYDCALLFHAHGVRLDIIEQNTRTRLLTELSKGAWPHLDILAPGIFEQDQDAYGWGSQSPLHVDRTVEREAFCEKNYEAPGGLFSPAIANKLVEMANNCNKRQQITLFLRNLVSKAPPTTSHPGAPWIEGMAILVEEGLLVAQDFDRGVADAPLHSLVMATVDHRALSATAPPSPHKSRRARL